jgi:phage shock protein A
MLDALREAFRQAIVNFRTELRGGVRDEADDLLRGMRQELVNLQIQTHQVEVDLRRARAEAAKEGKELETCLRREALARQAGDEETAEIARKFAEAHRNRQQILSSKVDVLGRELEERKRSLAEATARFNAATVQREGLSATARRTGARGRLQDADALFDEMDRMGERIEDFQARSDAAQEVDDALSGGTEPARSGTPPSSDPDVEARLEALKRDLGNR